MTDYGRPLQFGAFLTPAAADPAAVVARAVLAEQLGFDLVTFQDHPYQPGFLDAWTLLSFVAARTSRVTVAPNVANLPLRPPAVLARSVASLDRLSGGRVELGLGAGAFWDAIVAMGGDRRTGGESLAATAEAIEILRALWDVEATGVVRVEGSAYRVVGAKRGPAPAHPVGIWLGAYGPRMLALTGRAADGWLPSLGYLDPGGFAATSARVDAAAADAGRDPSAVRRILNVSGTFGRGGDGPLRGSPADWAEQLADWSLTHGLDTYVLGTDDPDDLRRFAGEVAPAVVERVDAERAGPWPEISLSKADPLVAGSTVAPSSFPVVATPDDGVRRSPVRVWDESARPAGPPPDPARAYTAEELGHGQHLVDIHDHLRAELARVQDLVEQVARGEVGVDAARSQINAMTMRQNRWTLGTYCESYCRVVTTHHTVEDEAMFPRLVRRDPRLAPVVDRLQAEHRVIHDVLEGVDRALVAMVSAGGDTTPLRAAVDLLSDTLLSHLSYEERELVEPLARLGMF